MGKLDYIFQKINIGKSEEIYNRIKVTARLVGYKIEETFSEDGKRMQILKNDNYFCSVSLNLKIGSEKYELNHLYYVLNRILEEN